MSTLESPIESTADFFGVPLTNIIEIIIIIIFAVSIERLVARYLSRFAKRTKLEVNVANNLALTFRVLVLIATTIAISRVGGLSAEWIISISAIGAAAIGFASQKTIGNFVAGLFLIAVRPFRVGNYVRIGNIEGIVSEININYTKILTSTNNSVSISNLQILDREITNYLYETDNHKDLYCYTFELGFDHNIPINKMESIFNQVFEKYTTELPIKPSYVLTRSTAGERVYTIYLYVTSAKQFFVIRPKIAEEVFQQWDKEKANNK